MAKVLDILREGAKEENVLLADLTGNFNLIKLSVLDVSQREEAYTYIGTIASADNETAV